MFHLTIIRIRLCSEKGISEFGVVSIPRVTPVTTVLHNDDNFIESSPVVTPLFDGFLTITDDASILQSVAMSNLLLERAGVGGSLCPQVTQSRRAIEHHRYSFVRRNLLDT